MSGVGSISEELGGQIRRRGYSLERVARESGVSKATIHRWMTGKVVRPYYWENLLNVANALNLSKVNVNRLLYSAGLPPVDTLGDSASPEQQALFARWTTRARNNLPSDLTSFIGRRDEILQIAGLLSRDDVRLVTLTGPGGAGKTRLSRRVANELHDVFVDGIFFVPLAGVADPGTIVPAIARALDVRDVPGRSTDERLVEYLRERCVLLVLDNVEHLLEAAPMVVSLLETVQYLTMLTTSRIPLRVSCEHVRPVSLFELPDAGAGLNVLGDNPAVRLFVERATAVDGTFRLDTSTSADVREICARLDGSPLAIELAAARCRRFSPREILERFPTRLDLGADGPRDLPDRQRSLRGVIDWSYGLLSSEAQLLFQRLSVFTGGWPGEAASAVCDADAATLAELVDSNLVHTIDADRYGMLETVREFALEQLEASGEATDLRQAHAGYFRQLAEDRTPYIPLNQQSSWLRRMDLEHDNLRAALNWSDAQGDRELLVAITGGLWPYWHEYGHFREGLRWAERALANSDNQPQRLRGSVLTGALMLAYSISEIPRARAYGAQALQTWQDVGDWHGIALVQTYLAHIEYTTGGDAAGFARAHVISQQTLDAWQLAGQPLGIAHSLVEMSVLSTLTGQFQQAMDLIFRAREIYERERNGAGLARAMMDQGLIRMLQVDLPGAIEDLSRSIHLSRAHGAYPLLPWGLFYLGTSYCFAGDLDQASIHLEESLRTHADNGAAYGMAYTLLGFAALRHRQGLQQESATLCGAVTALLEKTGIAMNPAVKQIYLRESQAVRGLLGDEQFEHAYGAGREMSAPEIVDYALRPGAVTAS